MSKCAVELRALHPGDMAFIERLYAGSRAMEMSHSGWPDEQIATFLSQQFHAQHIYYQTHYPDGEFFIVEHEGRAIGRLYLFWGPTSLNLIDITLLPDFQGRGIGTALIEDQLHKVDEQGLGVDLFVEPYNPAQRLYARMGFYLNGDSGVYQRLRRDPRTESRTVA
ncbi:GNAT family N-acetyltransferase [Stutzerimonas stutzeri]|uniref:GNAT family N-acetyltransferase n=1 Tax=Stutzerimonas stutzeri TaxID=316 RepID=UPI00210C101F|nr:GNAT family N-acetyltransferase [Stutzerimonas stutzeri]MCQ4319489.1 GNAT family N-acetyltransferase [Stutzerimonas stutzeri]